MNKYEKELVFELCKFKDQNRDKLRKLIAKGAATPEVLGQLFFNRLAAMAYGVLIENSLTDCVSREFRNSLKNAYLLNKKLNENFYKCLNLLDGLLAPYRGKYALLKGALLCSEYPVGYRTSNDIDILTCPEHISEISESLLAAGFRQGYLKNGVFTPATRKQIITSKMMRGETVPYIKEVNMPFMKYLEIDINHSLSHKNEEGDLVAQFIADAEIIEMDNFNIVTLNRYDFMLHLCQHLYKEATIYPWVRMKRDMSLYKFCDIYFLLSSYSKEDYEKLLDRAHETSMELPCCYAIYITKELFTVESANLADFITHITPACDDILNLVIDVENKKVYQYKNKNMKERFFCKNRTELLTEVN